MKNIKIGQFLSSLSKSELRQFGKFVNSPFHNNRKDVIKFFGVIKNYHPEFNIDSESIFQKLYPGKKYDPNVLTLLNAYLYNLGKEFFAISDLKENKFFYKYHFLNNLDNHQADDLFEKECRYTEDFLREEKFNIEAFRDKSLLELLKINFNLKRNRQENTCQGSIDYGDYLIYNFLIKLVENYHGMLANKTSFNYDFADSVSMVFINNFNFERFIKTLNNRKIENYDYIAYYFYLFMCNYLPENETYFSKLKEYSFKNFEKLSDTEKSNRFNYLIDYCIYKMELGNLKFLRESFNLYAEALDKQIFQSRSKDKEIGIMFFRNFVTIGLAAKENNYVEKFISEYGDRIKSENRKDLLELSYAMLNYEKKEYNKALGCISRVSNTIPLFRLSTKYILLKIYYDTNQFESFFSLIDTYRHYLKNDKIIPDHTREVHTILLNYAGRLAKIKSSNNNDGLFSLKKEIKENMKMDFRHKLWLLEKAEEIEFN